MQSLPGIQHLPSPGQAPEIWKYDAGSPKVVGDINDMLCQSLPPVVYLNLGNINNTGGSLLCPYYTLENLQGT